MDDKWKVIAVDSWNRDLISDWLVCDNCHSQMIAERIANLLNDRHVGDPWYYRPVVADHKLYTFEP